MEKAETITVTRITDQQDTERIIEAITSSSWVEASEIEAGDYSVEDFRDYLSQGNAVFCEVQLDGVFAGMASAFLMDKPSGDRWLYVDEVDVCADKQRKGVGKQLMKFLLEFAKTHNCDEVWLGTEYTNVPANALYASLSPTETEDFRGYLFKIRKN